MASKNIEIKIGLSGVTATKAQLKSVENGFDNLSVSGIGKLGAGARALSPQVAVITAALEAAGRAAAATTIALVGMEVALDKVGRRGSAVSAVASAFESIASPELLSRLQAATSGIVDSLDLMTHAGRALRSGMGSEDEIVGWFETVRVAASASGLDLEHSFERLAGILTGDELSLFEDLGVNITQIEEHLERLGMSAEDADTRIELLRLASERLNTQFAGSATAAGTYGLQVSALGTTLRDFADQVARSFAEDPRLQEWLEPITEGLRENLPLAEQWGSRLAELAIGVSEALIGIVEAVVPLTEAFLRAAEAGLLLTGGLSPSLRALHDAVAIAADATGELGTTLDALTTESGEAATETTGLARTSDDLATSYRTLSDVLMDFTESIFGNAEAVRDQIQAERDAEQADQERRTALERLSQSTITATTSGRDLAAAHVLVASRALDAMRDERTLAETTDVLAGEAGDAARGIDTMSASMRANRGRAVSGRAAIDSYVRSLRSIRTEAVRSGQALINLSAVQTMSDEDRQRIGEARLQQGQELIDHERTADAEREQISEQERKRLEEAEAALGAWTERVGAQLEAQRAAVQAARDAAAGRARAGRDAAEQDRVRAEEEAERELAEFKERTADAEREYIRQISEEQLKAREEQIAAIEEEDRLRIQSYELRSTLARMEKEDTEQARQAQIDQFDTVVDQAKGMANATKGLFGEISNAMEAMGVSTEKRKKAEGAFIIAYSSVMAVLEVAEAVKEFASQNYAQGAMHLMAMGSYIAAAVAAAAQLGGGSPKAPPAAATFTASDRQQAQGDTGGEGNTIVNNYSLGRRRGDLGGELQRVEWESNRVQARNYVPAGVSYS